MHDPHLTRRIKKMKNYRDFHDYLVEDLRKHPDEIEEYLDVIFEDFENEKNTEAFLLALRTIAEAKEGMTGLARKTNLSRQALYKALSADGNPRLDTIWTILNALGYRFSIKRVAEPSG